MKTIAQVILIVVVSLIAEFHAWKYRHIDTFSIVPPGVLCIIGMALIAGRGDSMRDPAKVLGRVLLAFGTFGIALVLDILDYDWWATIQNLAREELAAYWPAYRSAGIAAALVGIIAIVHEPYWIFRQPRVYGYDPDP